MLFRRQLKTAGLAECSRNWNRNRSRKAFPSFRRKRVTRFAEISILAHWWERGISYCFQQQSQCGADFEYHSCWTWDTGECEKRLRKNAPLTPGDWPRGPSGVALTLGVTWTAQDQPAPQLGVAVLFHSGPWTVELRRNRFLWGTRGAVKWVWGVCTHPAGPGWPQRVEVAFL